MNNKHLFEELIDDLCVLSEDGLPNLKSSESLSYISEFFNRKGLGELGMTLIQNLTEGEQFSNPALNKVIKYKTVNGEDAEGKVGNLLRRPKEEDAHKKALDSLGGEGSDTYKKAMDDLGGENQPDRNIDKEKEKKEDPAAGGAAAEQEPPKPSAFVGKAGDDYRANLPKNDPAYVAPKDEAGDGMDIETQVSTNKENLNGFIKNGYTKSKGAPGSPGSMLNEIVSTTSATNVLNSNEDFNYDSQLESNITILKDTGLGKENDGNKPASGVKKSEAAEVGKKYGISIGLASKAIIFSSSVL